MRAALDVLAKNGKVNTLLIALRDVLQKKRAICILVVSPQLLKLKPGFVGRFFSYKPKTSWGRGAVEGGCSARCCAKEIHRENSSQARSDWRDATLR